ncbi:hypothetical protein [Spirosoma gilvum]
METIDYSQIPGWGVDIDPKNDPTYPIKNRTDVEQQGYTWDRPPLQPVDMEVLRSIERPNVSAVFGTSTPPSGLSGAIRRFAFRFSESEYGHWLPLLLADRVNMVEGLVDDLKQGRIPNLFAEKGLKADWKYNRNGLIQRVAIGAVLTVLVFKLSNRRKRS